MIQAMRVVNLIDAIHPHYAPRKICAWCHAVIAEGGYPATHGICPPCVEKEMERYLDGIGLYEKGSPGTGST